MKLQDFLKSIGACEKACSWARNKTVKEAYTECKRGDWLLWLYGKLCSDFSTHSKEVRKRVLIAGLVANLVRDKMTDARCIDATDAAIAFGKGEIGIDSLNKAANAAYAVTNFVYTVNSTKADNAAINAAYAAVYATYAANAVTYAAYVTYPNAVDYAAYAAAIYAKSADIFRAYVSFDEIILLATTNNN
jgi:3-methyladenine DNA glycosylase Mpg